MQREFRQTLKLPVHNTTKGSFYQRTIKRPMDLILALSAIIVLSPVFLVVAMLVRIKIGSPVLFKQKRPGLNEKLFTLYKFKTMTDERDVKGVLLPDQIRLTGFGKLLRATSLDELPELWNMVRGDMAIVGPRPLLIEYLPYYSETERLRLTVRPGLTGLAQVNGRNSLIWENRFALDVEYVQTISFMGDIRILILTVQRVFAKSDVAEDTRSVEGNFADLRRRQLEEAAQATHKS